MVTQTTSQTRPTLIHSYTPGCHRSGSHKSRCRRIFCSRKYDSPFIYGGWPDDNEWRRGLHNVYGHLWNITFAARRRTTSAEKAPICRRPNREHNPRPHPDAIHLAISSDNTITTKTPCLVPSSQYIVVIAARQSRRSTVDLRRPSLPQPRKSRLEFRPTAVLGSSWLYFGRLLYRPRGVGEAGPWLANVISIGLSIAFGLDYWERRFTCFWLYSGASLDLLHGLGCVGLCVRVFSHGNPGIKFGVSVMGDFVFEFLFHTGIGAFGKSKSWLPLYRSIYTVSKHIDYSSSVGSPNRVRESPSPHRAEVVHIAPILYPGVTERSTALPEPNQFNVLRTMLFGVTPRLPPRQ
jgi:hypothetical protein